MKKAISILLALCLTLSLGTAALASAEPAVGAEEFAELYGGGNMNVPEGATIVASNSEMAQRWCEFLAGGEYTIYPDEVSPAGRVLPAA